MGPELNQWHYTQVEEGVGRAKLKATMNLRNFKQRWDVGLSELVNSTCPQHALNVVAAFKPRDSL